jgi:aminoglycoside phosphotransferase (APT) family kinase protein
MTTTGVEELGRRLRTVLGTVLGNVELAAPPRPLSGGAFSELFTFGLRDPPVEWSGRLVLRLIPWPAEQVRIEAGMQAGARAAGLPAPQVLFFEPLDGPLGTPFIVMEFLPGRPFLGGITRCSAHGPC